MLTNTEKMLLDQIQNPRIKKTGKILLFGALGAAALIGLGYHVYKEYQWRKHRSFYDDLDQYYDGELDLLTHPESAPEAPKCVVRKKEKKEMECHNMVKDEVFPEEKDDLFSDEISFVNLVSEDAEKKPESVKKKTVKKKNEDSAENVPDAEDVDLEEIEDKKD